MQVKENKAPQTDASTLARLPAYVDIVINRMKPMVDNPETKKKAAEQEKALLHLKRVMEARLRSESSAGDSEELAFDAGLDDDETLLRLMHAVDSDAGSNGDGAISEKELLDSDTSQLSDEIKKALRSAFACNLEAVEAAVMADPVLKNALSAEPPYQSRVVWGSTVAALGVVIPPLAGLFGFNVSGSAIVEFGSALVTLAGAGFALELG
jgi:hypothetical protein